MDNEQLRRLAWLAQCLRSADDTTSRLPTEQEAEDALHLQADLMAAIEWIERRQAVELTIRSALVAISLTVGNRCSKLHAMLCDADNRPHTRKTTHEQSKR